MIITACFFEDYLNCHTKCWLRSRGESGTGNTYADWVRTQSEAYREEGINRLLEGMLSDEYIVAPTEPTNLDIKKYQLVVDFKLRAEGAESCLHAVQRLVPGGRNKSAQFIPVRFVSTNKLTKHNKQRPLKRMISVWSAAFRKKSARISITKVSSLLTSSLTLFDHGDGPKN